jgi:hypothetical protein
VSKHLHDAGVGQLPLGTGGWLLHNGPHPETPLEIRCPMPTETFEFMLLLGGWVVAFLLGKELQTGFRLWRLRAADQRIRPPRD